MKKGAANQTEQAAANDRPSMRQLAQKYGIDKEAELKGIENRIANHKKQLLDSAEQFNGEYWAAVPVRVLCDAINNMLIADDECSEHTRYDIYTLTTIIKLVVGTAEHCSEIAHLEELKETLQSK
jgi:hypothetical protein